MMCGVRTVAKAHRPDRRSTLKRNVMSPDYWPQAIEHLSGADPVLATIIAAYPSERLECREDPFGTLARAIVGQQISVKAAATVWRRFEAAVGDIGPATVAGVREEALVHCGLSRQKMRYLKDLAGHFVSGTIDPVGWVGKDDEAVIAELTGVRGIGRWTAEMFLIFHLMRPDVLPLDDIGLQRATGMHYAGAGKKLDKAGIDDIASRWRPWRSVATWYLWRSLDPLPVAY